MSNQAIQMEAFCVIVQQGLAQKVLKYARDYGISGGTIFLGVGSSRHNKLLNFLDLTDAKKEIILMLVNSSTVAQSFLPIVEKFKFNKPNHGIAFTTLVTNVLGSHLYPGPFKTKKEVSQVKFKAIYVIVERGTAEDVMDAAVKAGSTGGTIINARGSGIHETTKVFNMEISPEKEVVLIIAKNEDVQKITDQIRVDCEIEKPGKGIIYIQDIQQAYGLK